MTMSDFVYEMFGQGMILAGFFGFTGYIVGLAINILLNYERG